MLDRKANIGTDVLRTLGADTQVDWVDILEQGSKVWCERMNLFMRLPKAPARRRKEDATLSRRDFGSVRSACMAAISSAKVGTLPHRALRCGWYPAFGGCFPWTVFSSG